MFYWEFFVTIICILGGIVLMAVVPEVVKQVRTGDSLLFDNNNNKDGKATGGNHPQIKRRLLNFADFFKFLTNEKTSTHIGGPEMKTLRGMLDFKTLNDLSPAVLRGWSRAVRDRAGTFHKVRTETCQFVGNLAEQHQTQQSQTQQNENSDKQASTPTSNNNNFCQITAQVEFLSLDRKDRYAFKSPNYSSCSSLSSAATSPTGGHHQNSGKAVSSATTTTSTTQEEEEPNTKNQSGTISVCPCLIRFRMSSEKEKDDATPIKEQIVGFHILPPVATIPFDKTTQKETGKQVSTTTKNDDSKNTSTNPPFDIISFIDPFELDQFAEEAVETLFDKKFDKDPMAGFWKFCVKPLQKLYDITGEEEKEDNDVENDEKPTKDSATTNTSNLPPKQRRQKLATDLLKVKMSLGLFSLDQPTSSSFSTSTTLNTAELDDKLYGPNLKSICARVTHTGPERDCIVTLHILLDADSPFGLGIVKYSFGLTAPKKKTMLFDQDTQNPLGTF